MAQRQNEKVRQNGTVTKRHGASVWHSDKMRHFDTATKLHGMVRHFGTVRLFSTDYHFCTVFFCSSVFARNAFKVFFWNERHYCTNQAFQNLYLKFFYRTWKIVNKIWESEYNNTEVGVKAIILLVVSFTPSVTHWIF